MNSSAKIIWNIIRLAGVGLMIVILWLLVNTLLFKSQQKDLSVMQAPELPESAVRNLQRAIQFKTVSYDDPSKTDSTQLLQLRSFLESAYPLTHATLTREIVSKYSLLYHWQGKDSTANPIIFIAHLDVVPVDEATIPAWTCHPFSGEVKDGFLWGRGAVDDKVNVISIFETIEKLLRQKFTPQHSFYLVFGHDEENGGAEGARKIAAQLRQRKVTADLICDEGGFITSTRIPGLKQPTALLGTSEKGFLSVEMAAKADGGHSSMPANETAIDILANAISRVREKGFTSRFTPSVNDFLTYIGPELPFLQRMAFANPTLFRPLILRSYKKSNAGNAMMRTTVVPTIISGGIKENVVPESAKVILNLRLLPGDSIQRVVEIIREIVNDDRITITQLNGAEASTVSSTNSFGYQVVEQAIRKTFSNTIVTPFLLIGGTDSKHFQDLSPSIIRFSPVIEAEGFHGINERISLDSYRMALCYYEQLMRQL